MTTEFWLSQIAAETKNFPVELLSRILPKKKAAKRYGGSSWKRKVCRTNRQPDTCDVKEGDVIMYGKYGGTEITIDGSDYLIMRASDILLKPDNLFKTKNLNIYTIMAKQLFFDIEARNRMKREWILWLMQ